MYRTKNSMKKIFQKYIQKISNIIFPISCIICKKDGKYLCSDCESNLDLSYKKINTWIYAKYKYKNKNLKKIEYAIKYNHHPELAISLGEHSFSFIIREIISKNNLDIKNIYLIPIPISKNRLQERGYNQTEYIIKGIKNKCLETLRIKIKTLNILIKEDALKLKDIYGVDARLEEIKNKMTMSHDLEINKNSIFILIDDITTTGATFYEARRALVEYGIIEKNIYAYSLAH